MIYLVSLILAIGFHPIHVMKRAWKQARNHMAEKERRRLADMEEAERIEEETAQAGQAGGEDGAEAQEEAVARRT